MDRKELIRAYKETRRPMGVFCVRNIVNGRVLIGASNDLPARLNRERTQLKFGAHRNVELQRDWNELGTDAFAFEVLDELKVPDDAPDYDPADDLAVLESLWLDRLEPFEDKGYMKRPRDKK
jgi:hypothetical protein